MSKLIKVRKSMALKLLLTTLNILPPS